MQTVFDSETVLFSESDVYSKNCDANLRCQYTWFLSEAFDIE